MMNKHGSLFGRKTCTAVAVAVFCTIGCRAASEDEYSPVFQTFPAESALAQITPSRSGSIRLDAEHALWDRNSLRWEWEAGDVLEFSHPFKLGFETRPDGVVYTPVFALNVYNEVPVHGHIKVEVGEASFTLGLNFSGWRAAQVRYFNDMEGTPPKEGKSYRIVAPDSGRGVLWLDGLIPDGQTYEALPQPDWQVPFIRDGEDEHRKSGAFRAQIITIELNPEIKPATAEEAMGIELISKRLEETILSRKVKGEKDVLDAYDEILQGTPVRSRCMVDFIKPKPAYTKAGEAFGTLRDVALLYRKTGDTEFLSAYFKLLRHIEDQGWVAGSILGSLHLSGYDGALPRSEANFLMRHVLEEKGLRDSVALDMQWLSNARECLIPAEEGNLDYMHTFMMPQLLDLLLTGDAAERVSWMRAFSAYINQVIGYRSHDDKDGFKKDGTAFHHHGHYPLYAVGAVLQVAEFEALLKDTPFMLRDEVVDNVRQSVNVMLSSAMDHELPVSLSGRHPFKTKKWTRDLMKGALKLGAKPASDTFFLPANYAALATHRRPGWFVVMRGFSKYVWPSEIFAGAANRYGVFLNHGTVEILLDEGLAASGYRQPGWDWRKMPGATTPLPPFEILKDFTPSHYYSRESFVGAQSLDGTNGQFSVELANDFFELRARKSVFCFGNVVVCLGNAIYCARQNYDTVTTLFQNAVKNGADSNIEPLGDGYRIRDAIGNSYLLADKSHLKIYTGTQYSFSQDKAEPTEGEYLTAWLDHGRRPTDESYAYTILVQADEDGVNAYASDPAVQVLEQSRSAHVVHDRATGITAAAMFESGPVNHAGLLKAVSKPCLVQMKSAGIALELSICDPDLQWRRERSDTVRIVLAGDWKVPEQAGLVFSCAENGETHVVVQPDHAAPVKLSGLISRNDVSTSSGTGGHPVGKCSADRFLKQSK